MVALSDDTVDVLADVAEEFAVTYPLFADVDRHTIDALGLRSTHIEEQNRYFGRPTQQRHVGLPYPGTPCECRKSTSRCSLPDSRSWSLMHRVLQRLFVTIVTLLTRSGRDKDLEIIVLRQQLTVLHRQPTRPALTEADRNLFLMHSEKLSDAKAPVRDRGSQGRFNPVDADAHKWTSWL